MSSGTIIVLDMRAVKTKTASHLSFARSESQVAGNLVFWNKALLLLVCQMGLSLCQTNFIHAVNITGMRHRLLHAPLTVENLYQLPVLLIFLESVTLLQFSLLSRLLH